MKEIIQTDKAPASSSPVSQGTKGGGLVFVGGQMPRDMESGEIAKGALEQARLSLKYCVTILNEAGSGIDDVLIAVVYMTDLKQKDAVNQAFKEYFGDRPPTRNLVEVSDIGEGTIVEIALTAIAH